MNSLIYIEIDEQNRVNYQHNFPFDEKWGLGLSKEKLENKGILVTEIPKPLQQEGKQAVMCVNPVTKEIYYKYEDILVVEGETLKTDIDSLKLENAELMVKSAVTDMEIETVKNENAELLFRVANLEMGGMLNV